MIKEYIAYQCLDSSILVDWNYATWRSGYPAYPKHKCKEIERGFSEGGKALVTIHTSLKEDYQNDSNF